MTRFALSLPAAMLKLMPADAARLAKLAPVKVGILVDAIGGGGRTPAQECADIVWELQELGDIPVRVAWAGTKASEGMNDADIDLLVFDYGAMWQHEEILFRAIDAVQAWAGEHPGKIALLWTGFTCWVYAEAEKTFTHLDNVWYRYGGGKYEMKEEGKPNPGLWSRLRTWYGVPAPALPK